MSSEPVQVFAGLPRACSLHWPRVERHINTILFEQRRVALVVNKHRDGNACGLDLDVKVALAIVL